MFTTHATNFQCLVGKPNQASYAHTDMSIRRCTTSSIKAPTTTDNRIANVTVSNGVVLPNSKQGTFWVTSANSNDINIATLLPEDMLIQGAVEPVPSASNHFIQPNFTSISAFRIQNDSAKASPQFYDALGFYAPVTLDTTSGIFDVNDLCTGHKMIHIKNNYGWRFRINLSST